MLDNGLTRLLPAKRLAVTSVTWWMIANTEPDITSQKTHSLDLDGQISALHR